MVRKTLKDKVQIKGKVFRAGNSLALRIPSGISNKYDLVKGSEVIIDTEKCTAYFSCMPGFLISSRVPL